MGAKNGIFPADDRTRSYLESRATEPFDPVCADPDAEYVREIVIALDQVTPQIAQPHQVDRVTAIGDAAGTAVQMVYLGTCTGGRARDFHQARDVLKAGGGVAPGVQLVVTPASRSVLETLTRDGTLADFIALGAVVVTPGCGSCCGSCGAIPGDGVTVISTANRNFKGRMGNSNASIFLASPASCAAAAVRGKIVDPREVCS
jgi:3-isopropylmalate/(R)-2-methylmalate dehydratase large subunit